MMNKLNFKEILNKAGEKATPTRINLLTTLTKEKYPLSIKEIGKIVKSPNESTLYRAVKTLVTLGFVREITLDKSLSRYEIALGRTHHHHIVCTTCGFVEDIYGCKKSEENATKQSSKKFALITGHNLEFSGICRVCVRK